MGIFRQFPYTNFHDLNLDYILNKIKDLSDQWDHFSVNIQEYVNNWLAAHPEATTTVQDGAITEAKIYPPFLDATRVWVNVASMVEDYDLNSNNIAQAINDALEISSYLYIPAWHDVDIYDNPIIKPYELRVVIEKDCTIILDEDCILTTAHFLYPDDPLDPIIRARNCSIKLYGGNIEIGNNDPTDHVVVGSDAGVIRLTNCHDSIISGLTCNYSRAKNLIWIYASENVIVENCTINEVLHSGIFIENECKNVICRNNKITNVHTAGNEEYCYFIATGVTRLYDSNVPSVIPPVYTPCDNIIFENNYCSGSEDCGIDSHGATNLIIRNNVILDSVNAITAYNDNRRAHRPKGWVMDNIIIENNYCDSNRAIPAGTNFPHAYLFIGASNWLKKDDDPFKDTATGNQCSTYAFQNCIVRNNVFRTANDYTSGAIYLANVSRNVTFENNDFYFKTGAKAIIAFNRSFYFKFINNRTKSQALEENDATVRCVLAFNQCFGEIANNNGFRISTSVNYISYIKGFSDNIPYDNKASKMFKTGDIGYISSKVQIVTSYGVCKNPAANVLSGIAQPFNFVVHSDGTTSIDDDILIPEMYIIATLGGTDTNCYVKDVIDRETFVLVKSDSTLPQTGTYTGVFKDATLKDLSA